MAGDKALETVFNAIVVRFDHDMRPIVEYHYNDQKLLEVEGIAPIEGPSHTITITGFVGLIRTSLSE